MRRRRTLVGTAAVLAVALAAACGGGSSGGGSSAGSSGSHTPVTLTVWHQYLQEESGPFQDGLKGFEQQYPWIHLKLEPQPNGDTDTFDPNLIAAIKGGNAPDVAIGFTPSYAGQYCSSGLWEDLAPFMQKDHMSITQFAPATLSYTKIAGKQCALPVADGRLRPLLQHRDVQEGGDHEPAADDGRARGRRQEAHRAQP